MSLIYTVTLKSRLSEYVYIRLPDIIYWMYSEGILNEHLFSNIYSTCIMCQGLF